MIQVTPYIRYFDGEEREESDSNPEEADNDANEDAGRTRCIKCMEIIENTPIALLRHSQKCKV